MTLHTSQHLLSALLETRLNLPTLSWSLTASPAPCYVELPRSMTVEEITSIQTEANQLVFEGRKVHIEVEELDTAQEPDVPKLASGREVGRGLPSDYTGGVKRVVVIDGVDRNPCCGTHLPSLHNLQLFLLPHTEALARSSTTSARLYFLAGPRLITHLSFSHTLLTGTAALLSCGTPQVQERVNQVVDERKRAENRAENLEVELAARIAGDLLKDLSEKKEDNRLFVSSIHRTDDSSTALGFLSAVAFSFTNALPSLPVKDNPYLIILSSTPSSQTSTSTSVVLIFGSDEKKVKEAGEAIKTKLGVKGGGKGPRWSGKLVGVWKESREEAAVKEVLGTVAEN
jgi:misacylated tRNA(Ala) deacylase